MIYFIIKIRSILNWYCEKEINVCAGKENVIPTGQGFFTQQSFISSTPLPITIFGKYIFEIYTILNTNGKRTWRI